MWVDSLCINQADAGEKAAEISKMYEYYQNARKCYILINMREVWNPLDIVDSLKFLDHVLFHMGEAALASDAIGLTPNVKKRLLEWADEEWTFEVEKPTVRSAAIDIGVLNYYSTYISYVRSLFDNAYFSRMWTFQEIILRKSIEIWGINPESISWIGLFTTWIDLATESKLKAARL
jgi:hypothetical protein